MKLFMLLLGSVLPDRNTEQHDVFFGIADSLPDLKNDIINFWPEAAASLHIDVYREVNWVDGYHVRIAPVIENTESPIRLFFINLGGYKQNEFEEYHYKMIVAATDKAAAIRAGKDTAFYKHCTMKGAESHVDDKYGIDVDDLYMIEDILLPHFKSKYKIVLVPETEGEEDDIHPGYLRLNKL